MRPGTKTAELLAALTGKLLQHTPAEGENATVAPGLTLIRLTDASLCRY